ncbi:MAG: fibronectin type III domain-containing protein [Dactylosporangium sp.]|nr:fibronectin type III domain-containing protein [Dactylosporangium sp.]NNJ61517.1 fibronectin type III domain-containing protein [Dactylosporangium sp.]
MVYKPKPAVLAAAAVGVGLLLLVPAMAFAAPESTKKLTIERAPGNPHTIEIDWRQVAGVHHYNVSVFDGDTDTVTVVPAGTTTMTLTRTESCVRLRVNVGSRDAAGLGGTSRNVWLPSLAPGGVSALRAERGPTGSELTMTWKPPVWPGYGTPGGYRVLVVRSTDRTPVLDEVVADPAAAIDGLDPATSYVMNVTAQNSFGSCATAKLPIGTDRPGTVASLKAVRDASSSSRVRVTWGAPAYPGRSPITHYIVGYGAMKATRFLKVNGTSTMLDLDPKTTSVVQVQPISVAGAGRIGSIKVPAFGAPAQASVDSKITIEQQGAQVVVRLSARIGANGQYPKLAVRIRPISVEDGFTDEQWGQNSAQMLTFGPVPDGSYLVSVHGAGDSGEVEWGKKIININETGAAAQNDWTIVRGRATLRGDVISIAEKSPNTQIISRTRRAHANMSLATTVTLRSGRGYGLWLRASVSKGKQISGYSLEYDPGYAKDSPSTGPSVALRVQYRGKACRTPLAVTKIPAKIATFETHHLRVAINGDTIYATVDGLVALDLPSLTAVTPASCTAPAPTGTQGGVYAGGSGSSVTFTGTTVN